MASSEDVGVFGVVRVAYPVFVCRLGGEVFQQEAYCERVGGVSFGVLVANVDIVYHHLGGDRGA